MKNCEGINMYKKNLVMLATVVMMAAFVSACGNGKQEIKETAVDRDNERLTGGI